MSKWDIPCFLLPSLTSQLVEALKRHPTDLGSTTGANGTTTHSHVDFLNLIIDYCSSMIRPVLKQAGPSENILSRLFMNCPIHISLNHVCNNAVDKMGDTMVRFKFRSVCGTSQFTGSSGPVPYTLHVFNGVKLVFRLSLSLPRKIVKITFMHCKAVVMIKVG